MIRNLARSLRSETITSLPADHGLSSEAKQEKKRLLQEERFGLPVPDSVLKEEEEEEKENSADREGGLTALEGERARGAFESVEGRVVEVVERNMSGVGQYLGDAFGW